MALAGGQSELVARLAGTTHGEGRTLPAYDMTQLCTSADPEELQHLCRVLFEEGGWDELIESTQAEVGVWTTCFLEGVLRAADCQVSKEGS